MSNESMSGQGKSNMTIWHHIGALSDEEMREVRAFFCLKAPTSNNQPLRAQLLREAEEITCGDRHMDYGDPVENHERIAAIASAATGHHMSAHDVVMVLIAAKMARARISPLKRDHYVDIMAYAGIAYECAVDDAERQDDDGLDHYDV